MTAPENIDKMRKHSQLGMAIYLDAYLAKKTIADNFGILKSNPGKTPVEILGNNVRNALNATDEYVWTWDERKWWPVSLAGWQEKAMEQGYSRKQHEWEKALPGITEAILRGKMAKKEYEMANAIKKLKQIDLKIFGVTVLLLLLVKIMKKASFRLTVVYQKFPIGYSGRIKSAKGKPISVKMVFPTSHVPH